jgi:hypothetical protein
LGCCFLQGYFVGEGSLLFGGSLHASAASSSLLIRRIVCYVFFCLLVLSQHARLVVIQSLQIRAL